MSGERLENIILCGLPGVGKSTVGKRLSTMLNYELIDTDVLVEEKCGCSCRHFFRVHGEKAFRKMEQEIVTSLKRKSSMVISLGGGTVELIDAPRLIPSLGIVVHLVEDINELIRRKIVLDSPATTSDEESYRCLANRRMPLLRHIAHIEINSRNKDPSDISQEIIEKVRRLHGE